MKLIKFISKACFPLTDSDGSVSIVIAVIGPLDMGLPRAEKTHTVPETGFDSVCRYKGDRNNLLWWAV